MLVGCTMDLLGFYPTANKTPRISALFGWFLPSIPSGKAGSLPPAPLTELFRLAGGSQAAIHPASCLGRRHTHTRWYVAGLFGFENC
jgi:hypothetical protein